MSEKPARARLKLLERRCAALKRQANSLLGTQELLVAQLLLLDSLCSSFSRMQAHRASQNAALNVEVNIDDGLELYSSDQYQLAGDISSSSSVVLQEDTENRRIAPRSRPLDVLDQVTSQTRHAVQDLTSRQLAAYLQEAVLHCSMQLQRQATTQLDAAACEDSMAQAWNR